jgi:anti-sigma regulatory factor (Ser/Thr protein kinase)
MQDPRQAAGRPALASGTDLDEPLNCADLAHMRSEIGRVLAGTDRTLIQDVQLVATELASNACEHADAPRYLRLCQRGDQHDHSLLIEVWDATPNRTPAVGTSRLGEHRGRGMILVRELCEEWGVRMDSDRKIVWGRVRLAR